jgi:hypothetical protein
MAANAAPAMGASMGNFSSSVTHDTGDVDAHLAKCVSALQERASEARDLSEFAQQLTPVSTSGRGGKRNVGKFY